MPHPAQKSQLSILSPLVIAASSLTLLTPALRSVGFHSNDRNASLARAYATSLNHLLAESIGTLCLSLTCATDASDFTSTSDFLQASHLSIKAQWFLHPPHCGYHELVRVRVPQQVSVSLLIYSICDSQSPSRCVELSRLYNMAGFTKLPPLLCSLVLLVNYFHFSKAFAPVLVGERCASAGVRASKGNHLKDSEQPRAGERWSVDRWVRLSPSSQLSISRQDIGLKEDRTAPSTRGHSAVKTLGTGSLRVCIL